MNSRAQAARLLDTGRTSVEIVAALLVEVEQAHERGRLAGIAEVMAPGELNSIHKLRAELNEARAALSAETARWWRRYPGCDCPADARPDERCTRQWGRCRGRLAFWAAERQAALSETETTPEVSRG